MDTGKVNKREKEFGRSLYLYILSSARTKGRRASVSYTLLYFFGLLIELVHKLEYLTGREFLRRG